jgi:tetratricopeptide (TPR) repeat protein
MKKYILFITLSFAMASCGDDFLDLTPVSSPNVADFYQTPEDLLNGVNAAYSTLQSGSYYGGRDFQDLTEYRADVAFDNDPSANSGVRFNIDQFLAGATNEIIENVWERLYQTIYRCNVVLDNADNVEMNSGLRNQYAAEVRFIRALSYFHAVQLWGPVPLVLRAEGTLAARDHIRNSVNEVYAAIEADLEFAAANLPSDYPPASVGRATSGAAQSLLGKVYLTQKKYAEAVSALGEVVTSGRYALEPSVADVFAPGNEYNDEIIFAVVFTETNTAEDVGLFFSSGIGDNIEPSFRALYDDADARKSMIEMITPPNTATLVPAKYYAPLSGAGTVGTDFIVLRYADVLLMYAEALNEVGYQSAGEAFSALNAVRTRAGLSPISSADLPNQGSFRNAVLKERNLELPLELHRWYDLLRTGRAIEAMSAVGLTINQNDLLFPIPNSQVLIYNNPSGFPQNPGY